MGTTREEISGLVVELARSLWAELGVGGANRTHARQAIDVEPLIVYTSHLGDLDSRLRAATIDWCIANADLISGLRLRNLIREASPSTRVSFGDYAATVKAHTRVPWPGEGTPEPVLLATVKDPPDLRRPALFQLRLRALVGVSARAEILRLLLADPGQAKPASALAELAAYGKGSVAQALDMLTLARFVQMQPDGNRLLYRLVRPAELASALQRLPAAFPDWWPIFRIAEALGRYARSAPAGSRSSVPHAQRLMSRIEPDLRRIGIVADAPAPTTPESIPKFDHWAFAFLAAHTGGADAMASTGAAT